MQPSHLTLNENRTPSISIKAKKTLPSLDEAGAGGAHFDPQAAAEGDPIEAVRISVLAGVVEEAGVTVPAGEVGDGESIAGVAGGGILGEAGATGEADPVDGIIVGVAGVAMGVGVAGAAMDAGAGAGEEYLGGEVPIICPITAISTRRLLIFTTK